MSASKTALIKDTMLQIPLGHRFKGYYNEKNLVLIRLVARSACFVVVISVICFIFIL